MLLHEQITDTNISTDQLDALELAILQLGHARLALQQQPGAVLGYTNASADGLRHSVAIGNPVRRLQLSVGENPASGDFMVNSRWSKHGSTQLWVDGDVRLIDPKPYAYDEYDSPSSGVLRPEDMRANGVVSADFLHKAAIVDNFVQSRLLQAHVSLRLA